MRVHGYTLHMVRHGPSDTYHARRNCTAIAGKPAAELEDAAIQWADIPRLTCCGSCTAWSRA